MRALWRRVGRAWARVQDSRYRGRLQRESLEEQRYQDRQARHDAGIFEPPRGNGGLGM
jgi:hypothetical protein